MTVAITLGRRSAPGSMGMLTFPIDGLEWEALSGTLRRWRMEHCNMRDWLKKPGLLVLGILGILLLGAAATVALHLRRAPHPHSVTLRWHAPAESASPQVVSYNIYRSTSPGGPYTPVASGVQSLTYKDELVNAGVTYYYVVRSVDKSGRESGYSEEVKVTIPDR